MIVREAPREDLAWIAERASLTVHPHLHAIEAVDEAGRIHGMVAYDGWTENACCVHVALENPAALRHLLRPGFEIPFKNLNRGVLLAQVVSTNARSLALVPRLGFKFIARIADGWRKGIDMVWFEMRREECRWIGA